MVYAACILLATGMVCWVVPRAIAWPLNGAFVALWLLSSGFVCLGLLLVACLFFMTAPLIKRPWIARAIALLAVLWGFLFILFNLGPGDDLQPVLPLSREAVVVPQAIVTVALVLLLGVGWRELCDRRVWTTSSGEASRHKGRVEG